MRRLLLLVIAGLFLLQGGCGGGGSSNSGVTPAPSNSSNVSGTAAAGIIKGGTVKIYALNADGSQGALLATTTTDGNGQYSQSLGSYSGPILAVAFGSYTDEATGAVVTLTEANALRAALPNASGTISLPITPLTDLAVRKAGSALTPTAISNANALVSSIFKLDIVGSNPVDCNATALGAAGVTPAQRDYTLALAGLSQMASSSSGTTPVDKLHSALTTLQQGIGTTINSQTASSFTTAVNSYLNNNDAVNKVIIANGGSSEMTVGSQGAVITLSLSGVGSALNGIDFVLTLPAGVTLAAQADGSLSNAVLGLSQTPGYPGVGGKYTPASGSNKATVHINVFSDKTFSNGALLVINANLAAGTTVTTGSFALSSIVLDDQNGSPVSGTLTVSGVKVQ